MRSLARGARLLAAVATALAAVAVGGQPAPGTHRIAFVNVGDAAPNAVNVEAFRRGLADLGYAEGRNIEIDFAWGGQNEAAMPRIAGEALRRKPDIQRRSIPVFSYWITSSARSRSDGGTGETERPRSLCVDHQPRTRHSSLYGKIRQACHRFEDPVYVRRRIAVRLPRGQPRTLRKPPAIT